jgi:hypothetical protein
MRLGNRLTLLFFGWWLNIGRARQWLRGHREPNFDFNRFFVTQ